MKTTAHIRAKHLGYSPSIKVLSLVLNSILTLGSTDKAAIMRKQDSTTAPSNKQSRKERHYIAHLYLPKRDSISRPTSPVGWASPIYA